ncbi:MAG: DUF3786 domain-containing protein [Clostridia bacterium]|nr:DUF3786 domain-containing protein [Clostridia bacterium]
MMTTAPNKNQQTGVPIEHYQSLFAKADPEMMSKNSTIPYDGEKFAVPFLNRTVYIYWPSMEVVFADDNSKAAAYTKILLSRLVLSGAIVPSLGSMKAYTEMPWGNVYAQQFRGRCILRLAFSYGNNIDGFRKACESIGGKFCKTTADASYDIEFVKGLTVRLLLWEGDEEFSPQAQVLFSDNFPSAFTAEDIAVVGDVLINAMKGRW